MSGRPYKSHKIEQLELLASNRALLTPKRREWLIEELELRTTDRATKLLQRLKGAPKANLNRDSDRDPELSLGSNEQTLGPKGGGGEMVGAFDVKLAAGFEELRKRLLDLTKRNRMLSYPVGKSRRQVQFFDEVLEDTYEKLTTQDLSLKVVPLPEPERIPAEEKTEEFVQALAHAKVSDVEYLIAIQAIESAGGADDATVQRAEDELRKRVRAQLGQPPRPNRVEILRSEHARSLGIAANPDLPSRSSKREHTDSSLQTLRYPDELERELEKIRADARLAEQESGLSTLYLSFGFLEWYESETSEKPLFAPLLLLPVKIDQTRSRGKKVFYLSATEGTADTNVSLGQFLASDTFGRVLPPFQRDDDDQEATLERYFAEVETAIDGLKRWQIRRWLVLGHFSFSRIAIYEDTQPEKWPIHPVESKLVKSLLSGGESGSANSSGTGFWQEDYRVDTPAIESIAPFLIQDADASQHSALVDVMKGSNLVIHGPPGTGKSQTIANIIANLIGSGKTVLFLAEKLAALEVVKRRLDLTGLGEFCLELHSDKANSRSVLDSLKQRLELSTTSLGYVRQEDSWRRSRDALNEYTAAIATTDEQTGQSPFSAIWRSIRADAEPDVRETLPTIDIPLESSASEEALRSSVRILAQLLESFRISYGPAKTSPWTVLVVDLARPQQQALLRDMRALQAVSADLLKLAEAAQVKGFESARELERHLGTLEDMGNPPTWSLLGPIAQADLNAVKRAVNKRRRLADIRLELERLHVEADLPEEVLTATERLVSSGLDSSTLALSCRAMWAQLDARANEARKYLGGLEGAKKLARSLGFEAENASTSQIQMCGQLAESIINTPPDERPYVQFLNTDTPEFAELRDRWSALATEEENLRRIYELDPDQQWPTKAEMDAAIAVFRKPAVERLIGKFSDPNREATALTRRLNIEGKPAEVIEMLSRLRQHVEADEAFEGDERGHTVLGEFWNGKRSPFDRLDRARATRERLRQGTPSGWSAFMERILKLPTARWASIAEALEQGKLFFDAAIIPGGLSDKSAKLSVMQGIWEKWSNEATLAADADPNRATASQPVSAGTINQARELAAEKRRLEDETDNSLHGAEVDVVERAVRWLSLARKLPDAAQIALINSGAIDEYGVTLQLARKAKEGLATLGHLKAEVAKHVSIDLDSVRLLETVANLVGAESSLSAYLAVKREADELSRMGLGSFVSWVINTDVDEKQTLAAFDSLLAKRFAEGAVDRSPTLSRASGPTLDAHRRSFVEQDLKRIDADRVAIRRRLLQVHPPAGVRQGPQSHLSELGLLQREFAKQRKLAKVRTLLARAGGAIRALKPCLMMSPLSLAKYLEAVPGQYDVLVIDEASQMRPEDALGAMLRCTQIVVVGDQKQLPPTSFFDRSAERGSDDGDDMDDLDDESILERCQKVFGTVRQLKWHYRSRCESLIRFSNENFYDGRLITFPAPRPGSFSIDLVSVQGSYQARCNVAEAERVAEEAIRFMRAHAMLDAEAIPSLGIVAINREQRDIIEETIARIEGDDEDVATFREKVASRGEEFFVKNLENVQGDERDFIFISLTYGRKPGAASVEQRFGPINSKQGHRRLNVLFSRARQRIALFTSMTSSDVKPTESSNEGVRKLRDYLSYVEQLGGGGYQFRGGEPDSDFEVAVADLLRARGLGCVPQVGVSGYRIDVGVVDPSNPLHFIAGIECDGAAYHSSATARDRDRIRQEVLENLGWKILRVWSTDWFANPEGEADRLAARLRTLMAERGKASTPYQVVAHQADPESTETSEKEGQAQDTNAERAVSVTASVNRDWSELLENESALTANEATELLRFLRDNVIAPRSAAEPHRALLRESMIEALITQRFADPEDWFTKVPQYLRAGTDPVEKREYLDAVCKIVSRIGSSALATTGAVESSPATLSNPVEASSSDRSNGNDLSWNGGVYIRTASIPDEFKVEPERLYDQEYKATLERLVEFVVSKEGPIFDDVLAVRIARLHGKDRTGSLIQALVRSSVDPRCPRTAEDYREIVWPIGAQTSEPVPFRTASEEDRSYEDVPEIELASLALPYLRLRLDEETILEKYAEQFQLQRIRAPSRARFLRAIRLASNWLQG